MSLNQYCSTQLANLPLQQEAMRNTYTNRDELRRIEEYRDACARALVGQALQGGGLDLPRPALSPISQPSAGNPLLLLIDEQQGGNND